MPDLFAHSMTAYVIARQRKMVPFLLFLGVMLPDLLTRPAYILFPATFWWVNPLHTPAGFTVACWTLAQCFQATDRRTVFWTLWAGCFLHLALDLLQKHLVPGYFPFFPLSWFAFEGGLLWPRDSVYLSAALGLGVVLMEGVYFMLRRGRIRGGKT